jgi:hypothetical protein
MRWSRRFRARLRAAFRAALGAWRDVGSQQRRGVLRLTFHQEISEILLCDAKAPVADLMANIAADTARRAINEKRRELGVA